MALIYSSQRTNLEFDQAYILAISQVEITNRKTQRQKPTFFSGLFFLFFCHLDKDSKLHQGENQGNDNENDQ
ncbi:MAG: hypothetical protein L0G96_22165 [Acinetobacter sp.]|nr:hypothetical protein [Acinetobacter sp.]